MSAFVHKLVYIVASFWGMLRSAPKAVKVFLIVTAVGPVFCCLCNFPFVLLMNGKGFINLALAFLTNGTVEIP